jgi:integrase
MVAEPKTKAGLRNVSLPHFMIDELKTHIELFISETTTAFLFASSNGNPVRRKVLQRSWNEARNKVGLPELHFHDLRHTGNNLAAMTGASIKELMARMGHASSVAALRYQHATLDRDLLIANKLNSMVTKNLKPIQID